MSAHNPGDFKLRPHLSVERVFDQIVAASGGRRIDAMLGKRIEWENADYHFDSPLVIAELKELHNDHNGDRGLVEQVSTIYAKYVARGMVPPLPRTQTIRIDLLPEPCRMEMITPFKRKLEAPVKKAARQIKETKRRLSMESALGLLILVNEGSTFLTPEITAFFLHHILKGQYSGINHIIYCSVNMALEGPNIPGGGGLLWSSMEIEGRAPVPEELCRTLYERWISVIDRETGIRADVLPIVPLVAGDKYSFTRASEGPESPAFVQPGKFYSSPTAERKYACIAIEGATARMMLLESYLNGTLVQAEFNQKLIHATAGAYRLITDANEIKRLKAILKRLRNK